MTGRPLDLDLWDNVRGRRPMLLRTLCRNNLHAVDNWARYLTPSPLHHGLGLVCLGVGAQRTTERLDRARVLDSHAVVLLTHGSGVLSVGSKGERTRMFAPTLFWLRPGTPHAYGPDTEAGWTESWLLFDGPSIAAYEALGFVPTAKAVYPLQDALPLVLVHKRLADLSRGSDRDVDVIAGTLVHEFLVTAKRTVRLSSNDEDDRLLAALRGESLQDLSVAERAARLGVEPRQLRRVVRRSAGCTPSEFVHRARVNRAKALLAETDLTVTEIARQVGFGDPAYFSRHFRASVGMSPKAFRSQQQQFLR
jgi:AraC-like DNA-binding protein